MPTSPQPLQLCCPQHRNTRWGRRSVPGHLLCARPRSGWEDPIRINDHPQTTARLPDSPHPSPPVWMRPEPLQEGDRPGTQALTLTHTSCPGRSGGRGAFPQDRPQGTWEPGLVPEAAAFTPLPAEDQPAIWSVWGLQASQPLSQGLEKLCSPSSN